MATDLLGTPLTNHEERLLEAYTIIKNLAEDATLPPSALSNIRVALASLGIAVNDLVIDFEHLTDYDC